MYDEDNVKYLKTFDIVPQRSNIAHLLTFQIYMSTLIERDEPTKTILMNIEEPRFFSNRLRGESHPRSKLTSEQVLQIRDLYKQGSSTNVITRNFKVSKWNA